MPTKFLEAGKHIEQVANDLADKRKLKPKVYRTGKEEQTNSWKLEAPGTCEAWGWPQTGSLHKEQLRSPPYRPEAAPPRPWLNCPLLTEIQPEYQPGDTWPGRNGDTGSSESCLLKWVHQLPSQSACSHTLNFQDSSPEKLAQRERKNLRHNIKQKVKAIDNKGRKDK